MLAAIITVALLRRSRLVPGLQPQTKARIIDAHVPVRPALNSLGHDRRDLLRHNPYIDRVVPKVPIAIKTDAVVDFSDLGRRATC